jgi:hypothetical protein
VRAVVPAAEPERVYDIRYSSKALLPSSSKFSPLSEGPTTRRSISTRSLPLYGPFAVRDSRREHMLVGGTNKVSIVKSTLDVGAATPMLIDGVCYQ